MDGPNYGYGYPKIGTVFSIRQNYSIDRVIHIGGAFITKYGGSFLVEVDSLITMKFDHVAHLLQPNRFQKI